VNTIRFEDGKANLRLDEVIVLYQASTLGERRPIHNRVTMQDMLDHANLIVTAWDDDLLVGIARTFTDFSYTGYLADLAVRQSHQHQGIGRALIEQTRRHMGPDASLVLLAAPKATGYYPKLGFTRHTSAWTIRDEPSDGDPQPAQN
jgi:GNAT superfamily N-acetyltransferase